MVDYFALALTHGLMALAAWRLIARSDLDSDLVTSEADMPAPAKPKGKRRA